GAFSYQDISKKTMPIAQPTTRAEGAPSWVTGSEKTADTADNGYDIDKASNPTSRETGKSGTVECHESYDDQQSKGASKKKADTAQNPYNWDENKPAPAEMADVDVKDTTGGDAPPPGQKASAKKCTNCKSKLGGP